jgi:hypothetical protein
VTHREDRCDDVARLDGNKLLKVFLTEPVFLSMFFLTRILLDGRPFTVDVKRQARRMAVIVETTMNFILCRSSNFVLCLSHLKLSEIDGVMEV